jgi:diguanylate cyclase (GGDEF)-like protein
LDPSVAGTHSFVGASLSSTVCQAVVGTIDQLHNFGISMGQTLGKHLLETLYEKAPGTDTTNSFGLLLIDKKINDNYGHPAGDEVLKAFSKLLQRCYRASDILCRYGGEEFLILLPNVNHRAACQRTEQLRVVLSDTPLVCGSTRMPVTASFGIATFPDHGRSREALISAADRALYAAKKAGRNRVQSQTEPINQDVSSTPANSKSQVIS